MFNSSSNWLREVVDLPNATVITDKITSRDRSLKDKSIVIVVSPLNALIDDQMNKLKSVGVSCTSLRICGDEVDVTFEEKILEDLHTGKFELIFTHPDVAVRNMQYRDLFFVWLPAEKCKSCGDR